MEIVAAAQLFSFNYTAYDQPSNLFISFSIYDVSSGSAVFLTRVNGVYAAFGSYMGGYTAQLGKTYLVIGVVYTDGTYTTPDTSRSPTANLYQASNGTITFLPFVYPSYDQATGLSARGAVYDVSSGSPVFVQNQAMSYVAFGVYFGAFTGTTGKTYNILGVIYTSGSFSTVDLTRAPSSDEFDCITFSGGVTIYNSLVNATLTGQNLIGILKES